jgi:hypothetical protein
MLLLLLLLLLLIPLLLRLFRDCICRAAGGGMNLEMFPQHDGLLKCPAAIITAE